MKENNINVNVTGEKLLLGSDFIKLEDETKSTFVTTSIDDFEKYVNADTSSELIFFDVQTSQVLIESYTSGLTQNTKATARLGLLFSEILKYLISLNKREIYLEDFIEDIKILRDYSNEHTLALIDRLDDLSIKKVISVDRSSDNQGNYAYSVKSENHGKADYQFPKQLTFTVPLFENNDACELTLSFDLVFKYSLKEGEFSAKFKLVNLLAGLIVKQAAKEKVVERLGKMKNRKIYYGNYSIIPLTDAWRYKENPVKNL